MMHTLAHSENRQLYYLSLEFMSPKDSERAMKRNLVTKIKLQEKIILKDQLMSLKATGTRETQSFAMKIGKKIKYDKEEIMGKVVRFIMNIKIEDALKDVKQEKDKVKRDQDKLDNVVRPSTIAAKEYRKLVKNKVENN